MCVSFNSVFLFLFGVIIFQRSIRFLYNFVMLKSALDFQFFSSTRRELAEPSAGENNVG